MYLNLNYAMLGEELPIKQLVQQNELTAQEAAFFQKFYGLKAVSRFRQQSLMTILEKLFRQVPKQAKIDSVMCSHTAPLLWPYTHQELKTLCQMNNIKAKQIFTSCAYNCVTIFTQLKLAQSLVNVARDILLVTLDVAFTDILKKIPGSTLLGDAATVLLLSRKGFHHRHIHTEIILKGRYAKGMWADKNTQFDFQENYLLYLSELILTTLKNAGISLNHIKYIFPHNVNTYSWKQVAKLLGISEDKIYLNNVPKYAHCFGSDPFINLASAEQEGLLQTGDYYLLVSVGLGAAFAAAVFQY